MNSGSVDQQRGFVVFTGGEVLLRSAPAIEPLLLSAADLAVLDEAPIQAVEIGFPGEQAVTAIEFSEMSALAALIEGAGVFRSLHGIDEPVDPGVWRLLSRARALLTWDSDSTFCPRCGAPTTIESEGQARHCSNEDCEALHFPRTNPAVIVRVISKGRILLARQARFRPTLCSMIAGFVEPGEDLEQAVHREVLEEVGLRVDGLRYLGSQPWPFPMNLMIAFEANSLDEEICCDEEEIESANWYTREQVHDAVQAGMLSLPSKKSIAHHMIQEWLCGDA